MMNARFVTLAVLVLMIVSVSLGAALVAQTTGGGSSAGRYQISAYGTPTGGGGFHHGCYVLDTATGQVWHVLAGGVPEKVADKLP
jgi:hypothetical protein